MENTEHLDDQTLVIMSENTREVKVFEQQFDVIISGTLVEELALVSPLGYQPISFKEAIDLANDLIEAVVIMSDDSVPIATLSSLQNSLAQLLEKTSKSIQLAVPTNPLLS